MEPGSSNLLSIQKEKIFFSFFFFFVFFLFILLFKVFQVLDFGGADGSKELRT